MRANKIVTKYLGWQYIFQWLEKFSRISRQKNSNGIILKNFQEKITEFQDKILLKLKNILKNFWKQFPGFQVKSKNIQDFLNQNSRILNSAIHKHGDAKGILERLYWHGIQNFMAVVGRLLVLQQCCRPQQQTATTDCNNRLQQQMVAAWNSKLLQPATATICCRHVESLYIQVCVTTFM